MQKLDRRLEALPKMQWSEEKKMKVQRILTKENMSSEDDDETRTNVFIVRRKPNQSKKLTKYKESLDCLAKKPKYLREIGPFSSSPLKQPEEPQDQWIIKKSQEVEEQESGILPLSVSIADGDFDSEITTMDPATDVYEFSGTI